MEIQTKAKKLLNRPVRIELDDEDAIYGKLQRVTKDNAFVLERGERKATTIPFDDITEIEKFVEV